MNNSSQGQGQKHARLHRWINVIRGKGANARERNTLLTRVRDGGEADLVKGEVSLSPFLPLFLLVYALFRRFLRSSFYTCYLSLFFVSLIRISRAISFFPFSLLYGLLIRRTRYETRTNLTEDETWRGDSAFSWIFLGGVKMSQLHDRVIS